MLDIVREESQVLFGHRVQRLLNTEVVFKQLPILSPVNCARLPADLLEVFHSTKLQNSELPFSSFIICCCPLSLFPPVCCGLEISEVPIDSTQMVTFIMGNQRHLKSSLSKTSPQLVTCQVYKQFVRQMSKVFLECNFFCFYVYMSFRINTYISL